MLPVLYMVAGFMLAAYSIVGNDSLQTLGTFLCSNAHRRWWQLWAFSSSVMIAVILYGWFTYDKDPSYDRLNKVYDKSVSLASAEEAITYAQDAVSADPFQEDILTDLRLMHEQLIETKRVFVEDPARLDPSMEDLQLVWNKLNDRLRAMNIPHGQVVTVSAALEKVQETMETMEIKRNVKSFITWKHLIPPFVLLILTRYGFPVSTSFLVLITFQPAVLSSMLTKSLLGYALALVVAILVYKLVVGVMERRWLKEKKLKVHPGWIVAQWSATAFLWSMWLIQDMANIFVYLPRMPNIYWLTFAIVWMVVVQAFIYYSHGGKIQKVVTSKTNTHDIRSATVVMLVYGAVLYVFKIQSNVPMSTTWVFLGLLAGREIAFALPKKKKGKKEMRNALRMARKDIVKAGFGLGVSVAIAFMINLV